MSQGPSGSITQPAPTPVDWEAEGFSQERGIPLAEARQRLDRQPRAPRLADRAATDLGEQFGGVWIDVIDGDRSTSSPQGTARTRTTITGRPATRTTQAT